MSLRLLTSKILLTGGSGVRLYDGPNIKLFILVGWGRSFLSVAWPTGVQLVFLFSPGFSEIHANTPKSSDCKDSKYVYQPVGHIVTGNLEIISDSRIRKIVSKGPKYRFPSYINFEKCREEIASALNDFCYRCVNERVLKILLLKNGKEVSSLSWINVKSFIHKILTFYPLNPNRHLGI